MFWTHLDILSAVTLSPPPAASTRVWFLCGWGRFHTPWWSLPALSAPWSCSTNTLFPSPATSAPRRSSWWSPLWPATSVSTWGSSDHDCLTSSKFCPTFVAHLNSCIFLVWCSWCVLRCGVSPCWLRGVGAQQGEGKHGRPGPQETWSQRYVRKHENPFQHHPHAPYIKFRSNGLIRSSLDILRF